jgi:phosphoglycerate dehydrogenase-like enzyme
MTAKPRVNVVLLMSDDPPFVERIFPATQRGQIDRYANLHPVTLTAKNFAGHRSAAIGCEAVLTGWGTPFELLMPESFPRLKIVLYSGGSVKAFATSLKLAERGVLVVSARFANSMVVARYCLAQILLAAKGFFRNTRDCRDSTLATNWQTFKGQGTYRTKVALLGFGMIARELAKLLRQADLEVLAIDPYLSEEEAAKTGVSKVTIEQAFRDAYVVSNHLPNIERLRGVINASLLASLPDGAVFLNTGRGAQVNEDDLAKVARDRPDMSFLLDVTEPEPPVAGHPFYMLPNIQLTSHIAGAMGNELQLLGDAVLADLERYCARKPLLYAEDLTQLSRLG